MRRLYPNGDGWFQDDNARPHRSKIVVAFKQKKNLRTLSWPSQSPDLNPIENLWAEIKRKIHNEKPTSLPSLERCVKRAWKSVKPEMVKNLIESMPRRIKAVIQANGGPTKY